MTIDDLEFEETQQGSHGNILFTAHAPLGCITVLDRLTGWGGGIHDTETGFTDPDGTFWLASGRFDIRRYGTLSIEGAVALIKKEANTCVGVPKEES